MSFPVNFWFISGEISVEKFFLENFYFTKRFVFKFQGESQFKFQGAILLGYFWTIVLIFAVISI